MSTDIATQIRARIDAIAAERAGLDDEERRLRKVLEALEAPEETTPVETSETPGLTAYGRERLKSLAEQFLEGVSPIVDVVQARPAPCRFLINQEGPAY